jgi:hypothetical protein
VSVRFVHTLTHVRTPYSGADDDYGQPAAGVAVETEVQGLVQPRTVREMEDSRSAGVDIGDHVIFLPLMDVRGADAFERDGDRFEVLGVRRFDFGRLKHLEVDCRRIEADPVEGS